MEEAGCGSAQALVLAVRTLRTSLLCIFAIAVFFAGTRTGVAQSIAFTLAEIDLIPEGITVDPADGAFYISSIHKNKIIKVVNGVASDFIREGDHGFMGGVGLHVDANRRILWACSGNIMGKKMQAGVFAFSLTDGALLRKVTFPLDTVRRFFNDLAIAKDGSVFITDTYGHCLWKWGLGQPLERLALRGVHYPNGIIMDADGRSVFVAADEGLAKINLATVTVQYLNTPSGNVGTRDIDGMGIANHAIFAIQNSFDSPARNRLVRYDLDAAHQAIQEATVIDQANPAFDLPTTLVINNNQVYVVANSHLGLLDQTNNTIPDRRKLSGTVILNYRVVPR